MGLLTDKHTWRSGQTQRQPLGRFQIPACQKMWILKNDMFIYYSRNGWRWKHWRHANIENTLTFGCIYPYLGAVEPLKAPTWKILWIWNVECKLKGQNVLHWPPNPEAPRAIYIFQLIVWIFFTAHDFFSSVLHLITLVCLMHQGFKVQKIFPLYNEPNTKQRAFNVTMYLESILEC